MADPQFRYRDDPACTDTVVSMEEFAAGSNASAVRIEPGEDARALLPQLDQLRLVEVNFPAFTDGRGYSAARILREQGYRGELRATGDFTVDQFRYLRRCGIDSFAPDQPLDAALVEEAMARYDHVYQTTVDGRVPVWALRHGTPPDAAA